MSDETWTIYGKRYVEESRFVERLTPEEIAELNKPAVEVPAEPKKEVAKKATAAKKAAPSTDK